MIDVKKLIAKMLCAMETPPYQTRTLSKTANIPANSGTNFAFDLPKISGYTPVGAIRYSTNHGVAITLGGESSVGNLYFANRTSSAMSTTVTVTFLYLKNIVGGVVRRLLKALQSLSYRKAVVVC